jgi:hypothetical protein
VKTLALIVAVLAAALGFAPAAEAKMTVGNWDFRIQGRYDFHTYQWAVQPVCGDNCITVRNIPQPIAKASFWNAEAHLNNGQWTMTVDDPLGLRCGNVYYGPTIPTRDVFTWDDNTLTGTLASSFATGCDGAPGGTFVYPFQLVRW